MILTKATVPKYNGGISFFIQSGFLFHFESCFFFTFPSLLYLFVFW